MENYELDENGFKKSKLSLDDLDKFTLQDLTRSANGKLATSNSDLQSKKGKKGGDKAKETGQIYEAAAKGREIYSTDPRLKTNAQEMGTTQGKKNVESGHLAEVRDPKKAAKVSGNVIRYCERCKKQLKGCAALNMHKIYHDSADEISTLINNTFSINELTKILINHRSLTKKQAFKQARTYARDTFYSIKIYEGTPGSNKDVTIYQKREALS